MRARCPVCRATLEDAVCRRCGCDLTLVRQAEVQARGLLKQALAALQAGQADEARQLARQARVLDGAATLAPYIDELAAADWRYFMPQDRPLRQFGETVREAALAVQQILGHGVRPDVYRAALTLEFANRRLPFETDVAVKVSYRGAELLTSYRVDWLLAGQLAVMLGKADNPPAVRRDLTAAVRLAGFTAGMWLVFPATGEPMMGWIVTQQWNQVGNER